MWCVCKFNEERDLQEVNSYGYVDLVKANQTSTIDVPLALVETQYNEIDDPRAVGVRPSDTFEAIQAAKVVMDYSPQKDAAVSSE